MGSNCAFVEFLKCVYSGIQVRRSSPVATEGQKVVWHLSAEIRTGDVVAHHLSQIYYLPAL